MWRPKKMKWAGIISDILGDKTLIFNAIALTLVNLETISLLLRIGLSITAIVFTGIKIYQEIKKIKDDKKGTK